MANRDDRMGTTQPGGGNGPGKLTLSDAPERPDRDEPHEDERLRRDHEYTDADWRQAREHTDPERRRKIREVYSQTLLPDLPRKAGFHRCWVSTTHSMDTPERRLALGYAFVMRGDLTGALFKPSDSSAKDGEMKGAVMWREMVAMECPVDLAYDLMREFHHDAPREMASDIYESLQALQETAGGKGSRIDLEEGFREAAKFVRPPRQFEVG